MSIAKTQTSESFQLSALLSFSGGLQDAYTYNVRDGVFANAQTGKVVISWYRSHVPCRCRPSERFMGTDTPVRCVSEI